MTHPIIKVWRETGWSSELHPVPELGLSEGALCIDTWNAAIAIAADQVEHAALTDEQRLEMRTKINKFFYNGVQS